MKKIVLILSVFMFFTFQSSFIYSCHFNYLIGYDIPVQPKSVEEINNILEGLNKDLDDLSKEDNVKQFFNYTSFSSTYYSAEENYENIIKFKKDKKVQLYIRKKYLSYAYLFKFKVFEKFDGKQPNDLKDFPSWYLKEYYKCYSALVNKNDKCDEKKLEKIIECMSESTKRFIKDIYKKFIKVSK
ncbi:hypothetical protein SGLAD_v1c05230 [Spiroplasma gladiatoris]|uniref:Lipoprotein n=1 Tax=Spiroplasma gladiatoris TaxID=2143 RepID=A0A4P7AHP0_9MOLU|nr:hypothetical protein [Spiroplasma gladiatoris]QBQ07722.1 hypothetical protein SGLAD_v1c05230 [Spiroplasma gladiatoris]